MKRKTISFYLVVLVFVLSTVTMVSAKPAVDYTVNTKDQCANPTKTVSVEGKTGNKYNVSTINVPESTCVKIVFQNTDNIEHTFSIDAVSADNVTYFNIYTTAGQTVSSNFWTPSVAKTYQYYCQVPGHKEDGMYGSLVVGNPSSSPGFGLYTVFLAFGLMFVSLRYFKRKR